MKLSREEVLHIAALARVGVTEEDVEQFGNSYLISWLILKYCKRWILRE